MTVVMVLAPTFNAMGEDKAPDVAATPLTVMVAFASFAVGITWTELSVFGTEELKFRYPVPVVPTIVDAGLRLTEASRAFVAKARFTLTV